jgi:hypothetical protein
VITAAKALETMRRQRDEIAGLPAVVSDGLDDAAIVAA